MPRLRTGAKNPVFHLPDGCHGVMSMATSRSVESDLSRYARKCLL